MRELPFDLHFEVGGVPVHLVHGSPRKVNEYLFEDKPASLYERLAAAETDRVLVFGHTHKPWVKRLRRGALRRTAARSASPRTVTRAAPSPSCALPGRTSS